MAPPAPWRMRARVKRGEGLAQAAEHRGRGEDHDGAGEDGAQAEAVRHPSAGRDQRREGQQVGRHPDVQVQGMDVEGARHLRQGRDDDRAVQVLHEEGPGHQQRHGGAARQGSFQGGHPPNKQYLINSGNQGFGWARLGDPSGTGPRPRPGAPWSLGPGAQPPAVLEAPIKATFSEYIDMVCNTYKNSIPRLPSFGGIYWTPHFA